MKTPGPVCGGTRGDCGDCDGAHGSPERGAGGRVVCASADGGDIVAIPPDGVPGPMACGIEARRAATSAAHSSPMFA